MEKETSTIANSLAVFRFCIYVFEACLITFLGNLNVLYLLTVWRWQQQQQDTRWEEEAWRFQETGLRVDGRDKD